MYQQMLEFVKGHLEKTDVKASSVAAYPFRNRFEHTVRVVRWARRIGAVEQGDVNIITIAAIFHDVGKAAVDRPHAAVSAEICEQYLRSRGYSTDLIQRVTRAVRLHSDKHLPASELTLEEQILMDADLLDESAALMILWESMAEGAEEKQSYSKTYQRILDRYYKKLDIGRHIKTNEGRRLFDENMHFVRLFLQQLQFELGERCCDLACW